MSKKEKTKQNEDKTPENLKGKQKRFTSEYQPTPKAKSDGWLKKRTLEELKNEIVDKSRRRAGICASRSKPWTCPAWVRPEAWA